MSTTYFKGHPRGPGGGSKLESSGGVWFDPSLIGLEVWDGPGVVTLDVDGIDGSGLGCLDSAGIEGVGVELEIGELILHVFLTSLTLGYLYCQIGRGSLPGLVFWAKH
jgi:hypothetical protein